MNIRIRILLVLSLFLLSGEVAYCEEWIKMKFLNDQYSIKFPGVPKVKTLNNSDKQNVLEKDQLEYLSKKSDNDDNIQYIITYAKLSDKLKTSKQDKNKFVNYRISVDQMVESLKGNLVYEKDIVVDKKPGKQIGVELPKRGSFLTAIFVRTEDIQFVILVVSKEGFATNNRMKRFFTSFHKE